YLNVTVNQREARTRSECDRGSDVCESAPGVPKRTTDAASNVADEMTEEELVELERRHSSWRGGGVEPAPHDPCSKAASPLPRAGQISDEQLEELYLMDDDEAFLEAVRRRGTTPTAETDENATVLGPDDPKNKNDHTTAEVLNRIPDVPKRSTDAASNGADRMTNEELVELEMRQLARHFDIEKEALTPHEPWTIPASPLPRAGQISDEQMKELFQLGFKKDLVEAVRRRGTPPAETDENATALGPDNPKNKNDPTTAEALNSLSGVQKRSTDTALNGADEMTEEELVELERRQLYMFGVGKAQAPHNPCSKAETDENVTALGADGPKNKSDHTTAEALNSPPGVPKRTTDAASNGADEMTEEELVEMERKELYPYFGEEATARGAENDPRQDIVLPPPIVPGLNRPE
ncbi:MAG: hypothetical protein GY859_31675, partial [Desulfobacterales bacterium]|nr:hypothetical protein [Desulfobacterales bacterium]